jgi:hypothetical protein
MTNLKITYFQPYFNHHGCLLNYFSFENVNHYPLPPKKTARLQISADVLGGINLEKGKVKRVKERENEKGGKRKIVK